MALPEPALSHRHLAESMKPKNLAPDDPDHQGFITRRTYGCLQRGKTDDRGQPGNTMMKIMEQHLSAMRKTFKDKTDKVVQ